MLKKLASAVLISAFVLTAVGLVNAAQRSPTESEHPSNFRIILLGTAGGPTINADRQGISTLVIAGPEVLLFDCGRNLTTSLARLSINPSTITKIFLTHLHSDHIISLPELYLYPWASLGRKVPLHVWGPAGTRAMMTHLQEAFAFDIHIRRDVDEKYTAEGIKAITTDVREGVVYEASGVKVTAFDVDHGPVKPALGYRVDYNGPSTEGRHGPSH